MASPQQISEVSATMLHPMSGAASPLFSKRPRSGKSIVQQEAPLALYFHCAAHRLNLAVVSACKLQSCKNAESYVGDIARFFITHLRDNVPWIKSSKSLQLEQKPES